jgi:hypothetical protein
MFMDIPTNFTRIMEVQFDSEGDSFQKISMPYTRKKQPDRIL